MVFSGAFQNLKLPKFINATIVTFLPVFLEHYKQETGRIYVVGYFYIHNTK